MVVEIEKERAAILMKKELMRCTVERVEVSSMFVWVKLRVGGEEWMSWGGEGKQ